MAVANKKSNEFVDLCLPDHIYAYTPKAVIGAVLVSFLSCGGDNPEGVAEKMIEEWHILHRAGIVPQKPPAHLLKMAIARLGSEAFE